MKECASDCLNQYEKKQDGQVPMNTSRTLFPSMLTNTYKLKNLRLRGKCSLALDKGEDGPVDYLYDDYGDFKPRDQDWSNYGGKLPRPQNDKDKEEELLSDRLGI